MLRQKRCQKSHHRVTHVTGIAHIQVVQAVGEADALRPSSPSGCPLLQQVLMTVNGGTEEGTAYSNGVAHSLGMTGEEASRCVLCVRAHFNVFEHRPQFTSWMTIM